MHKTLHKKLTEKHFYDHTQSLAFPKSDDCFPGFGYEMELLRTATNDLLQPRPKAIANLLKIAREI
jgi:hypothetical protein